jgi:pyruvate dehydrogenase (quinone)/pyruvate oxidase
MPETLSDAIIERLLAWDVDTIFGIPGDGINGFVEALRKADERVQFIHVRNEEVGALAAVGYAKFTGRLGVCFGTSGPGAAHLLNGLLDARMDQAPVLAITGLTYHDLIGTENLQGVDSDKLLGPVTLYNERVMGPAHVESVVDRACRSALALRGPAHIAIPVDFQSMPMSTAKVSAENVPGHSVPSFDLPVRLPARPRLEAAAQLLESKRKIVILAGAGARGASDELEAIAETLGAPIIKAMLGKDCVPDDSPFVIGGTGHTGTLPAKLAVEECDALLIVGSTMPFLKWYPGPGQAMCVQIDDRPERIGMRYPVDVALAGDARATLQELRPLLAPNPDRSFLESAQSRMAGWKKLMADRGTSADLPMKPQVPAWQLSPLLADDAILCGDAGTVAYWINRQIMLRRGQIFSFSGTNCTMTSGLSYAIGAQVAFPGRQVVAFLGDGSMTMQLGDLLTLVQHRLPVKLIVIKNNTLGLEKWEQMMYLGNPEYGNDLVGPDFVKIAEACGIKGVRIEDPARCSDQLRESLAIDGPVLIECIVDPNEPTIEAPIPGEHAERFFEAMQKGTKDRDTIAREVLANLRQEQRTTPDAVNESTKKLMERLEKKEYEKMGPKKH